MEGSRGCVCARAKGARRGETAVRRWAVRASSTLLTCVPIARWQPAHSRQIVTHRLTEAHSAASAPQSAQRTLWTNVRIVSPPAPRNGPFVSSELPNALATPSCTASAHDCIAASLSACRVMCSVGERTSR